MCGRAGHLKREKHDLATMPRCLGTVWMAVLVLAAASHFLAFVQLVSASVRIGEVMGQ